MKKLLSLALVVALLLSAMPMTGSAEATTSYLNTVFGLEGIKTVPDTLNGGDSFILKFTLRNNSTYDLSGVTVGLREIGDGKTNKYFALDTAVGGASASKALDMTSGEAYELEFPLTANCKLGCGAYPITLSFAVGGNEFVDRISIDVFKDPEVIGPGKSDGPDEQGDVLAGLQNFPADRDPSKSLADPGTCPNKPEEPGTTPEDPNKPGDPGTTPVDPNKKPEEPGGDKPAETPVDLPSTSGSDYPSFGGGNGGGVSLSGDSEKVKNKPKLIIDKYSFSPETPMAGEEFTMHLSFYNTNGDKGVRNIKIFLTSDDSAVNATPNAGTPASSSVFTPVNSSNTFYIGYIAPWDTVQKTITLTTSSTLAPKNYQVTANFEYEDADGNEYTAKELIGIPIIQKARLQTSEMTLPEEAFMGQPVEAKIDFYNTGKDTLYNLMVKLEGDVTSDTKQYYVGNFQSGSSDSFQMDFTTKKPGETKAKVVFTYEDSAGKEQTLEKEFSVSVSDQPMPDENHNPEGMPPEMMEPPKPSLLQNPIVLGGGALGLLGIGIFVYKKRKKKKEQEELTIDEIS